MALVTGHVNSMMCSLPFQPAFDFSAPTMPQYKIIPVILKGSLQCPLKSGGGGPAEALYDLSCTFLQVMQVLGTL